MQAYWLIRYKKASDGGCFGGQTEKIRIVCKLMLQGLIYGSVYRVTEFLFILCLVPFWFAFSVRVCYNSRMIENMRLTFYMRFSVGASKSRRIERGREIENTPCNL